MMNFGSQGAVMCGNSVTPAAQGATYDWLNILGVLDLEGIGFFMTSDGQQLILNYAASPEPSALGMALAGLLAVVMLSRRRMGLG